MNKANNLLFIKDKIGTIFRKRFNIDINGYEEDMLNYPLLGAKIELEARDMLYIFFDIENEFNISIPEEVIIQGNFNSINNLIKVVDGQI